MGISQHLDQLKYLAEIKINPHINSGLKYKEKNIKMDKTKRYAKCEVNSYIESHFANR